MKFLFAILFFSCFANAQEEVTASADTSAEVAAEPANEVVAEKSPAQTPVEQREPSTEQREPAAVQHIADQAKFRQYPGGRDEQDIKIQASLAQPTKNIDGSPAGEMAVPDDHDD